MRTIQINILTKTYPLCYSTRIVRAIYFKYGSLDNMYATIKDTHNAVEAIEGRLWMLSELLKAGQRYAALEQIESSPPPELDTLRGSIAPARYSELLEIIENAIAVGSYTTINAGEFKEKGRAKKKTTPRNKSPEWFLWHGLKIGLDYNTALDIPHGELLSLISAQNIYMGAPDESERKNSDYDVFPDWE